MKKPGEMSASICRDRATLIVGTSAMAERVRNHPWHASPLGSIEQWSPTLVSAVNLALNSSAPAAVYWGPELIFIGNDASANLMGPRLADALGLTAQELWKEHWPDVEQRFHAVLSNGESFTGEGLPFTFKRTNKSQEIHLNYSLSPVYHDGSIAGIYRTLEDKTEQVVAMRHLAEANERLRMALTAGALGVWDWHIQTGMVYADQTTAALYSINVTDAENGVPTGLFEQMVHPDDIPVLADAIMQCLNTGKDYSSDIRVNRGDGTYRLVRSMGRSVLDEHGHAYRVTGLKSEVTQSKLAESSQASPTALLPQDEWEKLPRHMQALLAGTIPYLVENPEQITLSVLPASGGTQISLRVPPPDLGKVIGKQGRTIRAFRTLLQAVNGVGQHRYSVDIEQTREKE